MDSLDTLEIEGSKSSQFLTSILMIAPILGLQSVIVKGDLVSKSYIDITLDIMKKFGIFVDNNDYKEFKITKQDNEYSRQNYIVESDWSSASYFIVAGAFLDGFLDIEGLNLQSVQGDRGFLELVKKAGVRIEENENSIQTSGVLDMILDSTYL